MPRYWRHGRLVLSGCMSSSIYLIIHADSGPRSNLSCQDSGQAIRVSAGLTSRRSEVWSPCKRRCLTRCSTHALSGEGNSRWHGRKTSGVGGSTCRVPFTRIPRLARVWHTTQPELKLSGCRHIHVKSACARQTAAKADLPGTLLCVQSQSNPHRPPTAPSSAVLQGGTELHRTRHRTARASVQFVPRLT